jgi:beta-N-acetylhexosaminidase
MKKKIFFLTSLFTMLSLILSSSGLVYAGSQAVQIDHQQQAKAILADMTPEEKVGQLFLVSFDGQNVSDSTQIAQLIQDYYVGGVVLSRENDNFSSEDTIIEDAYEMNRALQQLKWDASLVSRVVTTTGETFKPQYVPLFIGISEEGDGFPNDQFLSGVTELPNLMTIGATWDIDNSRRVGNVMGSELNAMGFNLILGPSLDVLDVVHTDVSKNLGSRTFSEDPYWTGELGKAYIEGIHEGSEGQMAVIAKHFPGSGGANRPPSEEVSTVRKFLEQLKQIELAPFFKVTDPTLPEDSIVDGLLVSNIRYQGFQGNIRETTKPVSFDQAALEQLLALEPLSNWRSSGGIMVSDDLDSKAIHLFYDPTGQTFDGRQIIRTAFLAGNDLLYVNQIKSVSDPDSFTTITTTLDYFAKKYREDSAFAERVDLSVERIIKLKLKMYDNFYLSTIMSNANSTDIVGVSDDVTFEIVRQAATLISPDIIELNEVLPEVPGRYENVVFISETYQQAQCSQCGLTDAFSVDSFKNAVLRLYGPAASGQILSHKLTSYSAQNLTAYLDRANQEQDGPIEIEEDIKAAHWLVFSVVNANPDEPVGEALQRFLAEKPDLLRDKNIIVFSFTAPYFLDATELSKITAFYSLYGKSNAAIEMAARLLFLEIVPTGSSPISIPATGYDLLEVTSPDPNQLISISLLKNNQEFLAEDIVSEDPLSVSQGEIITLRTGVILDHNQNPVPDETLVEFQISNGSESINTQSIEAYTNNGVAQISYQIQYPGLTQIKAICEPAQTSQIVVLDIGGENGGEITTILPTFAPTLSVFPVATQAEITPEATETPQETNWERNIIQWMLYMLVLWGFSILFTIYFQRNISFLWGIRLGLSTLLGGLMGYYGRLIFISAFEADKQSSIWITLLVILIGMSVGLSVGFVVRYFVDNKSKENSQETTEEAE